MAKRGKKYLEALKLIDKEKTYSLDEAIQKTKRS
jgi:large subunit ribosomal protein L1